ncbi:MAG: hypothetical protein NVSMB52_14240 [Chloroflexota bacterium]
MIVVVDDERDVLDLVCDLLRDEGHDVLGIDRPTGVLPAIDHAAIDLFILDLMLPDMSGIGLADALRNAHYTRTPMIAMSASPSELRAAAASRLFQETVAKPFDIETLLSCVSRHIEEAAT